jgi:hypothetical protein
MLVQGRLTECYLEDKHGIGISKAMLTILPVIPFAFPSPFPFHLFPFAIFVYFPLLSSLVHFLIIFFPITWSFGTYTARQNGE